MARLTRMTKDELVEQLTGDLAEYCVDGFGAPIPENELRKLKVADLDERFMRAIAERDARAAHDAIEGRTPVDDEHAQQLAAALTAAGREDEAERVAEQQANEQPPYDCVWCEQRFTLDEIEQHQQTCAQRLVVDASVPAVRDEIGDVEQHRDLPAASRWEQIMAMSHVLASSELVQRPLRGKPNDVALVLLASHDLGISATQGLQKLFVLDGKVSMSAELMVALVLSAGHELWPEESSRERVTVCGRRKGSTNVSRVTWTVDDAVAAGLCTIDAETGRPRSRDSQGRPKPWERFTQSMLWARAVSQLCRMQFADVLAGVSYTPDELGEVVVDVEGRVIDVGPSTVQGMRDQRAAEQQPAAQQPVEEDPDPVLLDEQRVGFEQRIAALSDPVRTMLAEEWGELQRSKRLRGLKAARQSDHRAIDDMLKRYEQLDDAGTSAEQIVTVPPSGPSVVDGVIEIVECPNCHTHVAADLLVVDNANGHTYCTSCAPM